MKTSFPGAYAALIAGLWGIGTGCQRAEPQPAGTASGSEPPVVAPSTSTRASAPSVRPPAHPPIVVGKVDVEPFLRAGCTRRANELDCSKVKAILDLGCQAKLNVSEALSALTPALPIAECVSELRRERPAPGTFVHMVGCMMTAGVTYVVWKGGAFAIVRDEAAFVQTFAPVDTPAEAAAFAVALRDEVIRNEVRPGPNERLTAEGVEPSFAEPDGDAFRVRLFYTVSCGCDHPTSAMDYKVTRKGVISELNRQQVLESLEKDCFD
jgi:hypothetical protein